MNITVESVDLAENWLTNSSTFSLGVKIIWLQETRGETPNDLRFCLRFVATDRITCYDKDIKRPFWKILF